MADSSVSSPEGEREPVPDRTDERVTLWRVQSTGRISAVPPQPGDLPSQQRDPVEFMPVAVRDSEIASLKEEGTRRTRRC